MNLKKKKVAVESFTVWSIQSLLDSFQVVCSEIWWKYGHVSVLSHIM